MASKTITISADSSKNIDYGTRMLEGKGYIIAANYEESPATVTFIVHDALRRDLS